MNRKRNRPSLPLRRGWRQGIMTTVDQRLIMLILLWQSIVRGADYWHDGEAEATEFALLMESFSHQVIGLGFIIPACMVLAGMVFGAHLLSWLGHWLLSLSYFTVSASVLITMTVDEGADGWQWLLGLFAALGAAAWFGRKATIPPTRAFHIATGTLIILCVVLLAMTNPTPIEQGLRFFGHFMTIGILHVLWALRMGPTPLDSDAEVAEAVNVVVAPMETEE